MSKSPWEPEATELRESLRELGHIIYRDVPPLKWLVRKLGMKPKHWIVEREERDTGSRPRLLDLFCGAGGAAMGYHKAGFDVVGVDINPQPNYPFTVIQTDALEWMARWIEHPGAVDVDAIHTSPPCQTWTAYRRKGHGVGDGYGDLITQTRELLNAIGLPWVMENVEGAPLHSPLMLCGSMFDLDVQRHRYFETDWSVDDPAWPCRHKLWADDRYPGATNRKGRRTAEIGVWRIPLADQQEAMGIDWMTLEELSEAIPPAYTEFVGEALMAHLKAMVTA